MMMRSSSTWPASGRTRLSAGFSLIEVMVGLVIALLTVLVISQVVLVSEGYRRTTTGGGDAQTSGAIALYGLERDLQQGGFGASGFAVIGCNVLLRAGVTLNAMGPVTINHASLPATAHDANTDTILVMYGNASGQAEGEIVQAQPAANVYTVAAAASSASAPGGFAVGDNVIVEPQARPSPCNLTMEPVTAIATTNVTVGTGVAGVSGGTVFDLGPRPAILAYAVKGGNLVVCDYTVNDCSQSSNVGNSAVWVPIATDISSLRAEYGRDTTVPMDGTVDVFDQSTPTTACLWARVSAVRLALVARNAQYNKENVTTVAPVWASASAPIDLSSDTTWQKYRYKVFQTTVPLRNLAWQGVQSGC